MVKDFVIRPLRKFDGSLAETAYSQTIKLLPIRQFAGSRMES